MAESVIKQSNPWYIICDVVKYGHYISSDGSYVQYSPWMVVKVPVPSSGTVMLLNAGQNSSVYSRFLNSAGATVGSLIQHQDGTGWSSSKTIPSNAVALEMTLSQKERYPRLQFS